MILYNSKSSEFPSSPIIMISTNNISCLRSRPLNFGPPPFKNDRCCDLYF